MGTIGCFAPEFELHINDAFFNIQRSHFQVFKIKLIDLFDRYLAVDPAVGIKIVFAVECGCGGIFKLIVDRHN